MLEVGSFPAGDCQRISRRAFVRAGLALPFAWELGNVLGQAAPSETPKAKAILLVWLGGGPSHLDTFDPKPKAPMEYRGPFATIPTRTPGVRFSELLPRLAARSNFFSLVRTNINYDGNHRPAGSIGLTGAAGSPKEYPPNFGAIVARTRSPGPLPSFISLARGPIGDGDGPVLGYGGGSWGKLYDPFMVRCSDQGKVDIPQLKLIDGLSPARLTERRLVLQELDRLGRQSDAAKSSHWDNLYRRAYALLSSRQAREAFDLSREPATSRAAYGYTAFGQSCLLGRRLVEAGVPYVQVNWSRYVEVFYTFADYGWDTHADNFGLLADWHCPLLDRVFATLLDDLRERGLLKTTLVVCLGEFGRTPRINAIGSRDHWQHCYFSLWAGGGVQPGRVVGESDPRGEHPATEPVTPAMVGTTILELAGVHSELRAKLNVLQSGRVMHELL